MIGRLPGWPIPAAKHKNGDENDRENRCDYQ